MTVAYLKRQNWGALTKIQDEPTAMLGVAGLAGALTIFLFFGGWKSSTINAQTVQAINQNSQSPVLAAENASSGSTPHGSPYVLSPIASNEIDLYGDSRANKEKTPSPAQTPDSGLIAYKTTSASSNPPAESPKPARTVKRATSPARSTARKEHLDQQNPAQSQTSASPAQPEVPAATASQGSEPIEAATNSTLPNPVFESMVVPTTSTTPKGGAEEAKKLYFEVGSFKDETWADNAVEKLNQLGFHAVVIHKNLLWSQSYHVEVGPYASQKDIAEARQSLALQGFKAH
jgi:cell division septation protein DedD